MSDAASADTSAAYRRTSASRRIGFLAAALAIAALPMLLTGNYWQTNLTVCAINVLLALGLDFILGYAGQLNLGQSAFYGLGAYVSTLLITKLGVPFWAAFAAGVASRGSRRHDPRAVRRAPARTLSRDRVARLRGDRPSDPAQLDQPDAGPARHLRDPAATGDRDPRLGRSSTSAIRWRCSIWSPASRCWSTCCSIGSCARRSARRSPRSARTRFRLLRSAIDAAAWKVFAFGVGAAVGGAAGCFYATFVGTLVPDAFFITESFTILSMVIVGGMGTLIGPVWGAILLTLLPELLRGIGDLRLVVYGVALTLVVLFMPGGLVQAAQLVRAKLIGAVRDDAVQRKRPAQELRRRARGARRIVRDSRRRGVRHHRTERRRQIDDAQPASAASISRTAGALEFRRHRPRRPAGAPPRPARHRAHVPEDPSVQAALGARQRGRGISHPSRHPGLAISRSRACIPARPCALPRRGDGAARVRRPRGAARHARGLALLRRAAHARVRARARDQADASC